MPSPANDISTETQQAEASAPTSGDATPELLLGFAQRSFRGEERLSVPFEGIVLGRKVDAFGSGLLDDPQLSRRHAEIRRERGRLVVSDLGSRNKTFVNGREVTGPVPLSVGDVIRVGSTLLLVCAPRPEPAPLLDGRVVGDGAATRQLRHTIASVAGRENTVLITGETGVGKEIVAGALHAQSGRRGAFIAMNCGALAEGVLESELFGHTRGAFTSAATSREGIFRAAERGTLFLDEIGEMPIGLQSKLLRVLETRSIRPVGAEQERPIDVRVVAATNRDVVADVLRGAFRSDLYARLAQWIINVRPLRERRDDIPLLARHLLGRQGAAAGPVEPVLAEQLLAHDWPLNVRGLLNVLSIALVASRGGPLSLTPEVEDALHAERRLASASQGGVRRPNDPEASTDGPKTPSAEELGVVLRRFGGKVADAARHLGCSRQQIYRWLDARGVDVSSFRPPSPKA